MWGTLAENFRRHCRSRFTPTHVGNTTVTCSSSGGLAVHPHACGEHGLWAQTLDLLGGSPPRMWGTPNDGLQAGWLGRFTPTHVGNTICLPLGYSRIAVHPHACGEHLRLIMRRWPHCGSPPRMWGTRAWTTPFVGSARFTPTHVGNTFLRPNVPRAVTVHPHACGEHLCGPQSGDLIAGSPPRMWGTLQRAEQENFHKRFTPTHVGNTCCRC